jgi:protein-disulfide isomerase
MTRRLAVVLSLVAISTPLLAEQRQGSVMASIKVEIYSDYSCPHCAKFHEEAVKPLIQDYVNKNKVELIHRDYILGHFKYSHDAAVYANAAAKIGKFVAVSDALWAQQTSWGQSGNVEGCVASVLSKEDMAKLKTHLKDPDIEAKIQKDRDAATKLPLTETPTIVISMPGKAPMKIGAVSYDLLKSFLDGRYN